MIRIIKTLLVLSVAMWGLAGVIGNFTDWEGTVGAVKATTSMVTFEGGADNWRATSNPVVVYAGALFIVLGKIVTLTLCFIGAWRMWGARAGDAAAFAAAKTFGVAGCAVAVFMLFTGWIVIGETWFELWRSESLRDAALGAAFRYAGFIGIIALFVNTSDA